MRTPRYPFVFIVAALLQLPGAFHSAAFGAETPPTPPGVQLKDDERTSNVRALLDIWRGDQNVLDLARSQLDTILRDNPEDASAHREYARLNIMDGWQKSGKAEAASFASAEASLKTSLRLRPNYAEAYVLAGHLYLQMGRNSEAKAALQKAEAIGTDDPWLNNNWADILMSEGDPQGASVRYKKVVDSNSKNTKAMGAALEGLKSSYIATGRLKEADGVFRKLVVLEKKSPWSYGNYAVFLLCYRDDAEAALNVFSAALGFPPHPLASTGMAAATYRKWASELLSGQTAQAAETQKMAHDLNAGDPVELVTSVCRSGPAVDGIRRAMAQQASRKI